MIDPHEEPETSTAELVNPRNLDDSLLLTSVLGGALFGNLTLLAIYQFVVGPSWGAFPQKGDPRTDIICWLSSTGEVSACFCGIVAMAGIAKLTSCRLRNGRAITCCVLLAVIVLTHFYPQLALSGGGRRPWFEVIPETILVIDGLIALLVLYSWAYSAAKGEQGAQPELPTSGF